MLWAVQDRTAQDPRGALFDVDNLWKELRKLSVEVGQLRGEVTAWREIRASADRKPRKDLNRAGKKASKSRREQQGEADSIRAERVAHPLSSDASSSETTDADEGCRRRCEDQKTPTSESGSDAEVGHTRGSSRRRQQRLRRNRLSEDICLSSRAIPDFVMCSHSVDTD